EFVISDDFNKMNFVKTYPAHQSRVTEVIYSPGPEWVISTGQDKFLTWMCTQSGSLVGRYAFSAWASCLQYPLGPIVIYTIPPTLYDEETRYAFVGDFSGLITLLKLEKDTCSVVSTLKGHEGNHSNNFIILSLNWVPGSISCMYWDPVQRFLFSGSADHSIILWDIGGRQGRTIILQGHHDKVQGLCYLQLTRQLVSCSVDGGICVWNMDIDREEAPQWLESDSCQKCAQPFFWNIRQMWDTKTLGLRQHHCRKCGQAVCGKCSSKRSSYPIMGFEFQVRVCDSCYETIKDEE
ncbi:hypothetical protein AB205_0152380, partial [Aquarana catesbeiana]